MSQQWDNLVRGMTCPFDAPRSASNEQWDLVAKLSASSLYLAKNQTYRGHCMLILDLRHAVRPEQLAPEEWTAFCTDLHMAEGALMRVVRADHINVALLGNVVPHLHWHIVPRYQDDPRWGAPIWPTVLTEMPDTRLSAAEVIELVSKLRAQLAMVSPPV